MNHVVDKPATLQELIDLRLIKKKTLQQIADIYGITRQAVSKRFKGIFRLLNDPEKLEAYQNNKIALLTAAEQEILVNLCKPAKLQKANLSALAMSYGIIYDKNRLEQGKSTENISYMDIVAEKNRLISLLKVGDNPDKQGEIEAEKVNTSAHLPSQRNEGL